MPALAVWAAVVLAAGGPVVTGWVNGWRAWRLVPFGGTLGPGLVLAPFRHAWLIALAGLFALACAGAGRPLRRLMPPANGTRRDRHAIDILLGFAVLGAWHLGLAFMGIFDARVLAAGVAVAALCAGGRKLAGTAAGAAAGWRRPALSPWWIAAFAAAAVPLINALVPDAHVDTLTYHLAIPEQILKARVYTFDGAGLTHLFPLTAELNYALAVMLGAHALPHLLQLVPFMAAIALLGGRAAERGGSTAGWLTLLFAFTWGETGRQLGIAKNDLAAAAYPLAAAVVFARGLGGGAGWWSLAALLAGCGAATKTSGLLTAATLGATVVVAAGSRRFPWRWAAVAGFPFLPWAVRAWLMTGDPVWPALSEKIPGALWDDPSAVAMRLARGIASAAMRWRGFLQGLHGLAGEQPALAIVLPGALWAAWNRKDAGPNRVLLGWAAISIAGFLLMMPGEWTRLSLAPLLVVAAVAAEGIPGMLDALPTRARPWLLAAGVLLTWAPLGRTIAEATDPGTTLRSLAGALTPDEALAKRRSTLQETGDAMKGLTNLHRVIGFGDIRGYRLPGRFLAERCFGRTYAWVLAGESATPDRIAVKLRQLGVTHILYNFVTEAFPHPQAAPFVWDLRRLTVWRTFVGRSLDIVIQPAHVDHTNGGFVVYAIRPEPLQADPAWLPYLPGVESLYYEVTKWGHPTTIANWLRAAEALDARVRNVDFIHDLRGVALRITNRFPEAYAAYAIGVRHGTINDSNHWDLAVCAFRLGRFEEAFTLFNRAVEISPYLKPEAEPVFAVIRQALARPNP